MLNTVDYLLKEYVARNMIDPAAARYALDMTEEEAGRTLVDPGLETQINTLVFAHVEGDRIIQEIHETEPRTLSPAETAWAITRKYIRKFENPRMYKGETLLQRLYCLTVFKYIEMTGKIENPDKTYPVGEIADIVKT